MEEAVAMISSNVPAGFTVLTPSVPKGISCEFEIPRRNVQSIYLSFNLELPDPLTVADSDLRTFIQQNSPTLIGPPPNDFCPALTLTTVSAFVNPDKTIRWPSNQLYCNNNPVTGADYSADWNLGPGGLTMTLPRGWCYHLIDRLQLIHDGTQIAAEYTGEDLKMMHTLINNSGVNVAKILKNAGAEVRFVERRGEFKGTLLLELPWSTLIQENVENDVMPEVNEFILAGVVERHKIKIRLWLRDLASLNLWGYFFNIVYRGPGPTDASIIKTFPVYVPGIPPIRDRRNYVERVRLEVRCSYVQYQVPVEQATQNINQVFSIVKSYSENFKIKTNSTAQVCRLENNLGYDINIKRIYLQVCNSLHHILIDQIRSDDMIADQDEKLARVSGWIVGRNFRNGPSETCHVTNVTFNPGNGNSTMDYMYLPANLSTLARLTEADDAPYIADCYQQFIPWYDTHFDWKTNDNTPGYSAIYLTDSGFLVRDDVNNGFKFSSQNFFNPTIEFEIPDDFLYRTNNLSRNVYTGLPPLNTNPTNGNYHNPSGSRPVLYLKMTIIYSELMQL